MLEQWFDFPKSFSVMAPLVLAKGAQIIIVYVPADEQHLPRP
jgi:hypothetical protein